MFKSTRGESKRSSSTLLLPCRPSLVDHFDPKAAAGFKVKQPLPLFGSTASIRDLNVAEEEKELKTAEP